MKRLILPALLFASTVAFAQAPVVRQQPDGTQLPPASRHMHHQHDPQKTAAHLSKKLNLTADQTARLEPVLAAQQQKMADLHNNATLTPQQMHQQMHAIHKDTQAQLAGVLTPDQLQQMKAMHHGHDHHGQHPQAGAPTPSSAS